MQISVQMFFVLQEEKVVSLKDYIRKSSFEDLDWIRTYARAIGVFSNDVNIFGPILQKMKMTLNLEDFISICTFILVALVFQLSILATRKKLIAKTSTQSEEPSFQRAERLLLSKFPIPNFW